MSWEKGFWWPYGQHPATLLTGGNASALDASGEICACIGRISIAGKAANKTIDTTGSSKIRFCIGGTPVFDNAGSVFTAGFQGIDKTTGIPVRPNGTWACRSVITTAADTTPTLTTVGNSHAATPTAGSSTFSHGDEVCFVLEMTTRAGTDSITPVLAGGAFNYPATVTNISGSWAAAASTGGLACEITFSDGTIGTIDSVPPMLTSAVTWADSSNPDEYGLIFQVPFDCTIDAIGFSIRIDTAASDMQFDLTSTPTGTPASLISGPIALSAENMTTTGLFSSETIVIHELASDVSLTANTDYCISVKATSTGSIRFNQAIPISAASRIFFGPAGTTMGATTRNGGTGAYSAKDTTKLSPVAVRISGITASSGGGGMRLAGHGGLAA